MGENPLLMQSFFVVASTFLGVRIDMHADCAPIAPAITRMREHTSLAMIGATAAGMLAVFMALGTRAAKLFCMNRLRS